MRDNTHLFVKLSRFCADHELKKPIDERSVDLMDRCAMRCMQVFPEILLAYGQSDEYSFVFRRSTNLFRRRARLVYFHSHLHSHVNLYIHILVFASNSFHLYCYSNSYLFISLRTFSSTFLHLHSHLFIHLFSYSYSHSCLYAHAMFSFNWTVRSIPQWFPCLHLVSPIIGPPCSQTQKCVSWLLFQSNIVPKNTNTAAIPTSF